MKRELFTRRAVLPALVFPLLAAMIVGIFVVDTLTDFEIAVAVLYVAVILLAARLLKWRGILSISAITVAATVLSYLLTQKGQQEAGLINCGLSLVAIAATSYLSMTAQLAARAERQAQSRLAAFGRAAALGELSASIAHEISQPLAALVLNGNAGLRWLDATPPKPEAARDALVAIVNDASRAGDVVNRIRSLSGGAAVPRETLAINEVVAAGIGLARDSLEGQRITLTTNYGGDLPVLTGDRIQLTQVVLNLVVNAIEAVSGRPDDDRQITLETRRFNADQIAIVVRDNGAGIAADELEQVFDAFFTTKATGMGFGLAISRTFVESHGGRIWAERSTPHGSRFVLVLPIADTAGAGSASGLDSP